MLAYRWMALLATSLAAGSLACSTELTGPTPVVSGLDPALVCTEQLVTKVALSGEDLSPLGFDTATADPLLALPAITLRRTQDLTGAAAMGTPVALPDDPKNPAASHVRWTSEQSMEFDVYEGLGLEPGLYEITVSNRNGRSVTKAAVLAAVARPVLTSVEPELICDAQGNRTLTLSGSGFVKLSGALPSIKIGVSTFAATAASGCSAIPGAPLPAELCNAVTVEVPKDALTPGTYDVTLTNPAPAACASTDAISLTIVAPPQLDAIEPDPVCDAQANRTLKVSGAGFIKIGDNLPTLTVGSTTFAATAASDCSPIGSAPPRGEICTALTVDVPRDALAPGTYEVIVTNPAPAGCTSTEAITLTVLPPPELTSVRPGSVCLGGGVLDLRGLHFEPGMTVTVGGTAASNVQVVSGTDATVTLGAGLALGGPYPVTVSNPSGCSTTLADAVSVSPGPLLIFVDPPVVWNGANTPVNVYATGVSGSVTNVSIVLSGSTNPPTSLSFSPTPGRADRPRAVVPAGTPAGTYDLLLTDSLGCPALLSSALRVTDTTTLQLTGILPSFGWKQRATSVAISASTTPPSAGFGALPTVYLTKASLTAPILLGSVARVSATSLTAEVPKNLDAGQYNVVVVNQDGSVGVLPGGFTVTDSPPPSVASITPPQVPNTGTAQAIVLRGDNFRAAPAGKPQVQLRCLNPAGAALADQAATVTSFTSTSINATINSTLYPSGANCVIVVTNTDDGSRTEFSSLVVVTPQQNLTNFTAGPSMVTARKGLGTVSGEASQQSRFVYAIAGDNGANALATVETLPVDIFGLPGSGFFTQRHTLNTARTRAGTVRIGRFIYALGGTSTVDVASGALATVERAVILDQSFHPTELGVDLNLSTTDGLGGGVYYYRVAAVMPGNDRFNPGGETLPSAPFGLNLPVMTGRALRVTLSWTAVPGAVGYRIYRSAAGGAVDGAGLIADTSGTLPGTVTCSSPTTCTDRGATPDLGTTVLPLGSTGTWTTLAQTMGAARQAPGVTFAMDPVVPNRAYIYVFGGLNAAGAALASYEFLTVQIESDGSQTLSPFTPGVATLTAARWRLGAYTATPDDTPRMAGNTYVWAGGGASATGAMVANFDGGRVTAGGRNRDLAALSSAALAAAQGRWNPARPVSGEGSRSTGSFPASSHTGRVGWFWSGPRLLPCG